MPVFNAERFVEKSIGSLIEQTYDDFELVISDNASTDGTAEICRDYAGRDRRITYIRNEQNIGGPRNFSRVFERCRGEYHKWSTADDYYHPTMLEKCVEVLDRSPDVVLCYPKTTLIDETGELISQYEDNLHLQDPSPSSRFMQLLDTIGLCNAHLGVIRRQSLRRTALIGDQLQSDVHLLAELTLYGRFYLIPEFLFFRRFHPKSSSWNRSSSQHQLQYYDPAHQTYFGMHTWRKYIKLLAAAQRSPIRMKDKLELCGYLFRRSIWDRSALGKELLAVIRRG